MRTRRGERDERREGGRGEVEVIERELELRGLTLV